MAYEKNVKNVVPVLININVKEARIRLLSLERVVELLKHSLVTRFGVGG